MGRARHVRSPQQRDFRDSRASAQDAARADRDHQRVGFRQLSEGWHGNLGAGVIRQLQGDEIGRGSPVRDGVQVVRIAVPARCRVVAWRVGIVALGIHIDRHHVGDQDRGRDHRQVVDVAWGDGQGVVVGGGRIGAAPLEGIVGHHMRAFSLCAAARSKAGSWPSASISRRRSSV